VPPTNREWNVYKRGVAPAPQVVLHHHDPRTACPSPNVVFVLGGPGAGKGTMCELAECQLGWTHLSTGELLRAARDAGGPDAAVIEEFVAAGKLAPNGIVVTLLKHAMERITRTTGRRNFLLDGFSRSLSNLEAWREVFA
jgi:UMP-CMP kinase